MNNFNMNLDAASGMDVDSEFTFYNQAHGYNHTSIVSSGGPSGDDLPSGDSNTSSDAPPNSQDNFHALSPAMEFAQRFEDMAMDMGMDTEDYTMPAAQSHQNHVSVPSTPQFAGRYNHTSMAMAHDSHFMPAHATATATATATAHQQQFTTMHSMNYGNANPSNSAASHGFPPYPYYLYQGTERGNDYAAQTPVMNSGNTFSAAAPSTYHSSTFYPTNGGDQVAPNSIPMPSGNGFTMNQSSRPPAGNDASHGTDAQQPSQSYTYYPKPGSYQQQSNFVPEGSNALRYWGRRTVNTTLRSLPPGISGIPGAINHNLFHNQKIDGVDGARRKVSAENDNFRRVSASDENGGGLRAQAIAESVAQPEVQPLVQVISQGTTQGTGQLHSQPISQATPRVAAQPIAQAREQVPTQPHQHAFQSTPLVVAQATTQAPTQPLTPVTTQVLTYGTGQSISQAAPQVAAQPIVQASSQAPVRPRDQPTFQNTTQAVAQAHIPTTAQLPDQSSGRPKKTPKSPNKAKGKPRSQDMGPNSQNQNHDHINEMIREALDAGVRLALKSAASMVFKKLNFNGDANCPQKDSNGAAVICRWLETENVIPDRSLLASLVAEIRQDFERRYPGEFSRETKATGNLMELPLTPADSTVSPTSSLPGQESDHVEDQPSHSGSGNQKAKGKTKEETYTLTGKSRVLGYNGENNVSYECSNGHFRILEKDRLMEAYGRSQAAGNPPPELKRRVSDLNADEPAAKKLKVSNSNVAQEISTFTPRSTTQLGDNAAPIPDALRVTKKDSVRMQPPITEPFQLILPTPMPSAQTAQSQTLAGTGGASTPETIDLTQENTTSNVVVIDAATNNSRAPPPKKPAKAKRVTKAQKKRDEAAATAEKCAGQTTEPETEELSEDDKRIRELLHIDNKLPNSLILAYMKPKIDSPYEVVREAAQKNLGDQSHLLFDKYHREFAMKMYTNVSVQLIHGGGKTPEWDPAVRNAEKRKAKKNKRAAPAATKAVAQTDEERAAQAAEAAVARERAARREVIIKELEEEERRKEENRARCLQQEKMEAGMPEVPVNEQVEPAVETQVEATEDENFVTDLEADMEAAFEENIRPQDASQTKPEVRTQVENVEHQCEAQVSKNNEEAVNLPRGDGPEMGNSLVPLTAEEMDDIFGGYGPEANNPQVTSIREEIANLLKDDEAEMENPRATLLQEESLEFPGNDNEGISFLGENGAQNDTSVAIEGQHEPLLDFPLNKMEGPDPSGDIQLEPLSVLDHQGQNGAQGVNHFDEDGLHLVSDWSNFQMNAPINSYEGESTELTPFSEEEMQKLLETGF